MRKVKAGSESFAVDEIGAVLHRGRFLILGVSRDFRTFGVRGMAFKPKRKGLPPAVVVSSHLPVDGPMVTEAIVHETLHIAFPRATEQQVTEGARLVAKVLRKFEAAKRPRPGKAK